MARAYLCGFSAAKVSRDIRASSLQSSKRRARSSRSHGRILRRDAGHAALWDKTLDRKNTGQSRSCRRNLLALSARETSRYDSRSTRDFVDANRFGENEKDKTLFGLLRDRALASGGEVGAARTRWRRFGCGRFVRAACHRPIDVDAKSLRLPRDRI